MINYFCSYKDEDFNMINVSVRFLPYNQASVSMPKGTDEKAPNWENKMEITSSPVSESEPEFIQSENVFQEG